MKSLFWFVFGIAGGFVAAHLLNKDPRGHELLAEVDARIGEFTDRLTEAYHEQERRFGPAARDAADAASGTAPSGTSASAD